MTRFKNKYRTESNRMLGWDYSGDGRYFITLVTQNGECTLGEVLDKHSRTYLLLSDFGKIVKNEFLKSFEIRNELSLDEYVIMPNHLHAIVVLIKDKIILDSHRSDIFHVETHGRASLHEKHSPNLSDNQPLKFFRKPKSISSFIGGYKSSINTKIDDYIDKNNLDIPKFNKNNHFFQANYYDHIIRNDSEYWQIKSYIKSNPKNWINDKFNNDNNVEL